MKLKELALSSVVVVAFISSLAHADVIVYPSSFAGDSCAAIAGNWVGAGEVSALNGLVHCTYGGNAQLNYTEMPKLVDFNADISLNKTNGASVCPATENLTLPGSCNGGVILLNSSAAHLTGNLSEDGGTVSLKGTTRIKVGSMTFDADVNNMVLRKQA